MIKMKNLEVSHDSQTVKSWVIVDDFCVFAPDF